MTRTGPTKQKFMLDQIEPSARLQILRTQDQDHRHKPGVEKHQVCDGACVSFSSAAGQELWALLKRQPSAGFCASAELRNGQKALDTPHTSIIVPRGIDLNVNLMSA